MTIEFQETPFVNHTFLTKEQQKTVIQQVVENEAKGRQARQEKEEIWQRCWRAYHNYVDRSVYRKQPWRSKLHLPWSFQAVEAGATELQDLLLPNDEDFFAVQPITEDDRFNADVMTKYLKFLFRQMNFTQVFSLFLKQLCVTGNSVLKVYWKHEMRTFTRKNKDTDAKGADWVKHQEVMFDGPSVEVIHLQDFVLFPASGNLSKAMCIHRLVKDLEEIQGNPIYRNTSNLKPDSQKSGEMGLKQDADSVFGIYSSDDCSLEGVELLEAWGDFVVEGKIYRNYVATVANRNTLIRFQANPYDYGMKPFVFASLVPVPGQLYGTGLLEPALGIQSMANSISNIILDEMKLKLNGQWKYEEDGVFNPNQFVSRPGGTVKVGNLDNLVPLHPNIHLDVGFAELNALKSEFEETTGVTKYSKGSETFGKSRTASEAMMLQQAGSRKFTRIAKHLNDCALTKTVELVYLLVRQFGNPLEIARYTGFPLEQVHLNVPLSSLDFKITGLQTNLLKQQNIENTERFVTGVANTPALQFIRWDILIKQYYKLLGFENVDEVLFDEKTIQALQQMNILEAMGTSLQQTQDE